MEYLFHFDDLGHDLQPTAFQETLQEIGDDWPQVYVAYG